ncbi:MAG: hypothetical protein MJ060_01820, partial [Clostridia bacterium]|nr:hypothetical protein [Clostridia bacterium]
MNWGNSLLLDWAWPLDKVGNAIDKLVYGASTIFHSLLYFIWRLLAWIVAGIEGIFRNLAGIGSTGKDMTTEIINNSNVQAIFGNLVGLSTALIVFFTIVKIIQDHYKEKDGGNPYKTVFRTFKGLLMFFFVSAAVSVGLYASQVMFRALDAATGSGTSSIAGQVFKIMAESANRKALGERDEGLANDTFNEYYKRVADGKATTDGVYFMTEISDEGQASSPSELAAKYLELFPTMQYGVVSSDGARVTPMAQWLDTAGWEEHFKNEFSDYNFGQGSTNYTSGNTGVSGSAGFKSDLLQGVELTITPSIDLTWSPVNIDSISYQLVEDGDRVPHPVQIPLWSYTLDIPMSTQFKKFKKSDPVRISLEESAKQFGISMHGGVSLQGGEASAGFSIETFDVDKFNTILFTLAANPIYTNLFDQIMGFIPSFPAQTTIWAAKMDWVRMFAPLIGKAYKAIIDPLSENIIPKTEDGKLTAEIFSDGASGHNAGIWSVMNTKSSTLETTIERYTIDSNFGDIWGTLSNSFDGFINQITEATENAWDDVQAAIDQINDTSDRIAEQQEWQAYKAQVERYNEQAAVLLTELGNMLKLWDTTKEFCGENTSQYDSYVTSRGFSGGYSKLETDIKNNFVSLVRNYNDMCYNKKPGNNYADPCITMPIYLPIIEFDIGSDFAGALTVPTIKELCFGTEILGLSSWVNLLIDEQGLLLTDSDGTAIPSAYPMIDWKAYGSKYKKDSNLNGVGELYSAGMQNRPNAMLVNDDFAQLKLMDVGVSDSDLDGKIDYDECGGIAYFLHRPGLIGSPQWEECTDLTGKIKEGYWSTEGIVLKTEANPIYYRYTGTTYVGNIAAQSQNVVNNHNNGKNSTLSVSVNEVRPSKAVANSLKTAALTEQNEYLDLLRGKSETKDTELINKFADHIITFRKMGTAASDIQKDMKVLDTWCKERRVTKPNGAHEETMLYNLTPEEIDVMMANSAEARRYLLVTSKAGQNVAKADASNWGSRIGQFSWNDTSTVNALYHYPSMSFVAGYISIIAALGVYMNFAFGLIQRAINMAVLYMMSPITIAFYPFDDGSKFNNGFVKPFYNEAISAFAIIVSLNLFIVLLTPVQKAVTTAIGTGNAFTTTIVGWLALVAFVSMLPQVRSMVQSVLGGSKMGEKSLTDTFKAAGGAISAPFKDIKNAKSNLVKGVEGLHKIGVIARAKAKKGAGSITSRFDEKLKQRKAAGEDLGFWGERRLAKLEGRDLKAEQQQRIDKARELMKNNPGMHDKDAFEQAGMNARDIKRYNKQKQAAEKAAQKLVKMEAGDTIQSVEARRAAKAQELLNDPNFKKSVNGVIATKHAKKLENIRNNDKVQQKALEQAESMVDASAFGTNTGAYQAAVRKKQEEILQKNPFGLKKEVSKLHHAKEWVSKLPANVAEIGKGVAEGIGDTWVGKAGK